MTSKKLINEYSLVQGRQVHQKNLHDLPDIHDVTNYGKRQQAGIVTSDFLVQDLPTIISYIGISDYPDILLRILQEKLNIDHIVVFVFSRNNGVTTYTTIGRISSAYSERLARDYTLGHWYHHDPNLAKILASTSCPTVISNSLVSKNYSDQYRERFFDNADIDDKIALCGRMQNDSVVYLNLHRLRKQSSNKIAADCKLISYAPTIAGSLMRHLEIVSCQTKFDIKRPVFKILTDREREVCAHILAGRTSEGIALTMNISINTVNTFRKRAYARLGISSQNELAKLAIGAH